MALSVLHSVYRWLHQTETWLRHQVRFLPGSVESNVVCETVENLDQFPVRGLHSFAAAPRWRRFWDKSLRRLGLRRHLGFVVGVARRQGAKVLHSHFGNLGWANLEAARRARLLHVVSFYGQDMSYLPRLDPRWRERYHDLFEAADLVLCEGPHMARRLAGMGCPEPKLEVHHLGVDLDALRFEPRSWRPGEPLRVLIAASFREKKGIPHALAALGRLREEAAIEVTLIGDANEEPRNQAEKSRIIEAIEEHRLGSVLRRLGKLPYAEVMREAYEHHVFLAPSITARDGDSEGGAPVVLIEMAATGMPLVSTRHADIPEVVEDGVSGLLADEGDEEGLLGRLRWLMTHPESWGPMAAAGRRRIELEFNGRRQGERLEAVYRRLYHA